MKKSLWSLALLSSVLMTSCGDELVTPENKKYPLKLETENSTVTFTYNTNGQMTKMVGIEGNNFTEDRYISYSDNGKPNKITIINTENNNASTEVISVVYNSDTQITLTSDSGNVVFLSTDAVGKILTQTSTQGTITYQYDAQGNAIQLNKADYTMSAVFGNTYGVFSAVNTPQWVYSFFEDDFHLFKANNPTSKTEVVTSNGVGVTTLTTYQYPNDYMFNGYPTRVISTKTTNGVTTQSLMKITY
jgi:hypothetical protein